MELWARTTLNMRTYEQRKQSYFGLKKRKKGWFLTKAVTVQIQRGHISCRLKTCQICKACCFVWFCFLQICWSLMCFKHHDRGWAEVRERGLLGCISNFNPHPSFPEISVLHAICFRRLVWAEDSKFLISSPAVWTLLMCWSNFEHQGSDNMML